MKTGFKLIVLGWLFITSGSTLALAQGILSQIHWQTIKGYDVSTLHLIISSDAKFSQVIANMPLRSLNSRIIWQAPGEGVFHFRIEQIPSGQPIRIGTFAVLAGGDPSKVVQAHWHSMPESTNPANRSQIEIFALEHPVVVYQTQDQQFVFRRRTYPVTVKIYGYEPQNRSGTYSFNPTLSLKTFDSKSRSPAAVVEVPDSRIKVPDNTIEPSEISPTKAHSWSIFAGGSLLEEYVGAFKDDQIRSHSGDLAGFNLNIRGRFAESLQIEVRTSLHHSSHQIPSASLYSPEDIFVIDEDRLDGNLSFGFEPLSSLGYDLSHHFTLQLGVAYRELPHLPLDGSISGPEETLLSHGYHMLGGGLDYRYQGRTITLGLATHSYKSQRQQAFSRDSTAEIAVPMTSTMDFSVAGFYQLNQGELCDQWPDTCPVTHTVRSEKAGITLGITTTL